MNEKRRSLLSIKVFGWTTAVLISLVGAIAVADFVNGGFESGTLGSWTVTTYTRGLNTVGSPVEDTLRSGLSLTAGGTDNTSVVSGTSNQSEYDTNLGASASLRFPLFGTKSGRVNYMLSSSTNANSLKQTITITTADIDTSDNKAHVRFAVAPVLQDGGHVASEQPYYFINVRNVTKASTLFHSFKYANQPGVPWKNGPAQWKYTDWQLVDVSPGAGALDVGDSVEVEIIAARCEPTGHSGYVYVDGFGSFLPGLNVVASGPQAANENTDITYTYLYRNGAATPVTNATITIVLPTNVTFVSMNTPGVTCTTPSFGGTGTVTCNMGTLPQNAVGSIQMTVHINASYTGTIGHGNYSIASNQSAALLGPLVRTTVTSGVSYADLETEISNGVAAIGWGTSTQYLLTVTNNGPVAVTGATVAYTPPAELTNVTWTCSGSGAAVCAANGTGAISESVTIPVGESVAFVMSADVVPDPGTGPVSITHTATATVPGGVTESYPDNNTAVDVESVGVLAAVTADKNIAAGGTISSAPAGISCGTSCPNETRNFLDGAAVTLQAVAGPTFQFTGWSGGGCSGTASCTFVPSGATTITATFDCATGYYGATCATQCPGSGTCSGHGTCSEGLSGTGQCTCAAGYLGNACEINGSGDSDGDTLPDGTEGATDADGDGRANYLDLDSDNDGVVDSTEGSTDADSDGKGNYIDGDTDGDGIRDVIERASFDSFVGPSGSDSDNDGVDNAYTSFPTVDTDGDGTPDYLDTDSDGDGVSDATEAYDINNDGGVDVVSSGVDANGDGVDDAFSAYSTPGSHNRKWREVAPATSPGGNQCSLLDISKKTAKVTKARGVLLARSQEFAKRVGRCGKSAANRLKQARARSTDLNALLQATYGGVVYSCAATTPSCTDKDVTTERRSLETLAHKLGAAQIAIKKQAISSCGRPPEQPGAAHGKGSPEYVKDLVNAIKALPTRVTRCS